MHKKFIFQIVSLKLIKFVNFNSFFYIYIVQKNFMAFRWKTKKRVELYYRDYINIYRYAGPALNYSINTVPILYII